ENPHAHQQQHREPLHQQDHPPWIALVGLGFDLDVLRAKRLYQIRIGRRIGLVVLAIDDYVDRAALDGDLGNLPLFDLIQKIREDFFGLLDLLAAEHIEQQQEHQAECEPQSDTAGKLVHSWLKGTMRLDLQATHHWFNSKRLLYARSALSNARRHRTLTVSSVTNATRPRTIPGIHATCPSNVTTGKVRRRGRPSLRSTKTSWTLREPPIPSGET